MTETLDLVSLSVGHGLLAILGHLRPPLVRINVSTKRVLPLGVNENRSSTLCRMTDDERQALEDTARLLLHPSKEQKGTAAGMEVALLELYRAQFTTDDRKYETMARLKMSLKVLEADGRGAQFLTRFIGKLEPWTVGRAK